MGEPVKKRGVAAGVRNDQGSRVRNAHGLTAQQEMFAQALAAGKTQTDAYRQAYPTSVKWPERDLWSQASRTAKIPVVRYRVEKLRDAQVARTQEVTAYTVHDAMRETLVAYELALATRQAGALNNIIQTRAKLNGLMIERKEVAVTQMGSMTPTEKAFALEQLQAELAARQLQLPDTEVTDVVAKNDASDGST